METQSLVSVVPWTFIATIINLLLTMLIVKKFLFGRINAILEKRQKLSEKELTDARAAKQEATDMKESYEASIANAKQEASEIIQNAQKEAEAKATATIEEAKQEAADMKSQAQSEIAQEKKKAVNEAKDEIGSLAVEIAGKVVEKEISEEDHRKLIDDFLDKVGDAS